MKKILEKLAKLFLCPLNIHIKKGHFDDYGIKFDYCLLCLKENYNGKWLYNPY